MESSPPEGTEEKKKRRSWLLVLLILLFLALLIWMMLTVKGPATETGMENNPSATPPQAAVTPVAVTPQQSAAQTSGTQSVTSKNGSPGKNGLSGTTTNTSSSTSETIETFNPAVLGAGDASAASTNYRIEESQLGGSGDIRGASSANFISEGSTAGDLAVGNTRSTNYQSNTGFNTTPDPRLQFVVDTTAIDFGDLSPSAVSTGTGTFNVLAYNANGYVVTVKGATPSNGSHNLTNNATDTPSMTGTEQFGINLVDNTNPNIGANPVQVPDSTFSFGVAGDGATANYNQIDKFRYNSGETIASAPRSSGQTNFTISFIINVSSTTPSGHYHGELTLIATGTY